MSPAGHNGSFVLDLMHALVTFLELVYVGFKDRRDCTDEWFDGFLMAKSFGWGSGYVFFAWEGRY